MHATRSIFRMTMVLVVAACGCGTMLGGCSRADAYRMNPTPELDTTSQRRADIDNKLTITNDTNLRLMNEDLGRLLLLDNPSRASPQPAGW